MTYDQNDVDLMVLCIWREARGELEVGMRAVGHVIKNRVGAPGFAKTVHEVILGRNQFSSMSIPSDPEYQLHPLPGDAQAAYCTQIVPQILDGTDPDNTFGAVWYANESTMTSGWYVRNIVSNPEHPATAVIGKQTFRK